MARGIITAPQPEAVEAGAVVMQRGGNAVDAAITCALVQTVVDPQMCGLAGFGSMHLYLPKKGFHGFIDFHTRAPAAVTDDMWEDQIVGESRDGFGFFLKERQNEVGYQSIMIPGSLKAYYEAVREHGTMDWKDVCAPAIDYAENGFVIRPHVYEFWTKKHDNGRLPTVEKMRCTEAGRSIYFDENDEPKKVGTVLKNPDMARSLRRIAEGGADVFYSGDMAEEIAADMQANGGLLSLDDLKNYETVRSEPLWSDYRDYRISTNQPPGGGIMVLEMLNILENFDLAAMGHNSPEYIRVVSEAMKYATIDKDTRVGDPRYVEVPFDELLDKGYAASLAAQITAGEISHVERLNEVPESQDTTHVCTLDADGNAVTMTHSLGMPSGVVTKGLGFMYNGCMSVFDPRPGRAGSLAPGKGRFTAMSPTIVFKGDDPHVVIGAPGGTFITMGVLQGLLNTLDFGMSISDAIAAPRFSTNSDTIDVTNRIPRFVTDELEKLGYPVARSYLSYHFAGVHAIRIDDGVWTGAADPGRDGMALIV
ncbi:MAG: gamma-glutamyltransferase [Rhodospirillaceae bacterium]|nr:gamma-glutamyltransferase [Rhodospirillaceae bacterium]MDD9918275.1 gamma-glutamyltransferase [Rhodospirillaceae bacterium]